MFKYTKFSHQRFSNQPYKHPYIDLTKFRSTTMTSGTVAYKFIYSSKLYFQRVKSRTICPHDPRLIFTHTLYRKFNDRRIIHMNYNIRASLITSSYYLDQLGPRRQNRAIRLAFILPVNQTSYTKVPRACVQIEIEQTGEDVQTGSQSRSPHQPCTRRKKLLRRLCIPGQFTASYLCLFNMLSAPEVTVPRDDLCRGNGICETVSLREVAQNIIFTLTLVLKTNSKYFF